MRLQKMMAVALLGSLASTSAFAQNNNTGEIVIQGVVPGVWELSVFDINSGYDFDLRDSTTVSTAAEPLEVQRVGSLHIHSNNLTGGTAGATLVIESANSGRMINNQSINGIAGDHQEYQLALSDNAFAGASSLGNGTVDPSSPTPITDALDGTTLYNLVDPVQMNFAAGAGNEGTLDVLIQLGDGTNDNRPTAAGVYSDVITFTIMDSGV